MLLLCQVLLLLILLLLATVTEWAPHWSMSLVPTDVASPHVSEISVLQVQNAVPCPVVASPASIRATWCLLMESKPWLLSILVSATSEMVLLSIPVQSQGLSPI